MTIAGADLPAVLGMTIAGGDLPAVLGMTLAERRFDDRRERGTRPVESRLDRAKVAVRDLGDLLIRLALELAKNEDLPMVLGKRRNRIVDELTQVAPAIHVVG